MNRNIRFLVMDVDGTLTDGKIYMGEAGELFKAFNIKDGCGIKDILPQYNIVPVIITARESKILSERCRELGIIELYQGMRDKNDILARIIARYSKEENSSYTYRNVAYIGDDLLDLPCMKQIKEEGGMTGCPSDACKAVKQETDYICVQGGGAGAVREFIEWLIAEKDD